MAGAVGAYMEADQGDTALMRQPFSLARRLAPIGFIARLAGFAFRCRSVARFAGFAVRAGRRHSCVHYIQAQPSVYIFGYIDELPVFWLCPAWGSTVGQS